MSPASAPEPVVPSLVLACGIVCIAGAAALANCAVIAALLKRSRNDVCSIITQLAVADLILLGTIGPELWSSNARTWHFGTGGCVAYKGLGVFATTASLYLVATVALHTLATLDLEEKAEARRNKGNDPDDEDEIRSSRHSLVATSVTSTPPRTMNVDYRLANTRVPVRPPTAFVWVLSASLSVPQFVLATTAQLDCGVVLCTIVDKNHRLVMHSMLAIFNLFLPIVFMTFVGIIIILKLKSLTTLHEIDCESVNWLKFSLCLLCVYVTLCMPRSLLEVYSMYESSIMNNGSLPIEMGQQRSYINSTVRFALSTAFLFAILIRPILYVLLLPCIRKIFLFGYRNSNIDDV